MTALANDDRFGQAAFGGRGLLRISAGPATMDESWIGDVLLGKVLTVAGVYTCRIDISGFASKVQAHIKATFAGGTHPVALLTRYIDETTQKIVSGEEGNLTTTVLKSLELEGMLGERWAYFTITRGVGADDVTITQAEFNGR